MLSLWWNAVHVQLAAYALQAMHMACAILIREGILKSASTVVSDKDVGKRSSVKKAAGSVHRAVYTGSTCAVQMAA